MNFNSNQEIGMNEEFNNPNKKGKKIIIILMIFLLIILIVTYAAYSYYVKNVQNEALRNEFFEKVRNNDINFFTNNELYTKLVEKVKKDNYESTSNIKLSTTMQNNMFSKLDVSKFEFTDTFQRDNKNNKSFNRITTKYAGNDFLIIDFLGNEDRFAIKSDEIVNKYVGIEKNNTQKISDKLVGKQTDLSLIKDWKNFIIDREMIDFEKISQMQTLTDLAKLIKDNTSAQNFSKKENVIVTMDSEQVETTEYTVEISNEQWDNILNGISQGLENNSDIVSELVVNDVKNSQNESGQILEYKDNENIVEISGEENNFNTYLNWEENNTNMVLNQIESNAERNTNTVIDNIQNQNATNIIPTETQSEIENNNEENITQVQTDENEEQINNDSENANVINNQVFQEEDNFRTQGFIEVNDNEENKEEDYEEVPIIGENFEDTINNISKLSDKINWSTYILTGAKANDTQEKLREELQKVLAKKIKQNGHLIAKMYISEEKNIKMNFEIPESEESFDIEVVSKGDQEKYLNITTLIGKNENANGYRISLYKKNADADVKMKIDVNKIHKNKINQKANMNIEIKGTTNSKKYNINANISYSDRDGELKAELENVLNFDFTPQIEDLNQDNCLFIDGLSDQELLQTKDVIKQKTLEVLREKNRNLNIIDLNNENSVVQQMEQNYGTENVNAKEDAKKVLIQTISNKMGEYMNAGNNLRIEDLNDLQIPGYEVNVSISSNLAIITVNGYKFKLDSDFNLSD